MGTTLALNVHVHGDVKRSRGTAVKKASKTFRELLYGLLSYMTLNRVRILSVPDTDDPDR